MMEKGGKKLTCVAIFATDSGVISRTALAWYTFQPLKALIRLHDGLSKLNNRLCKSIAIPE
jgi:hypothetical protein